MKNISTHVQCNTENIDIKAQFCHRQREVIFLRVAESYPIIHVIYGKADHPSLLRHATCGTIAEAQISRHIHTYDRDLNSGKGNGLAKL